MAHCRLYLTQLPKLSPYELNSAALPGHLDRQRLREALIDRKVPKGPLAISDQLNTLGPVLQALRDLGADGYVVEEASVYERLRSRVRTALGKQPPKRPDRNFQPSARAAETPPTPGRWQYFIADLRDAPWGRMVLSVVAVGSLVICGYLLLRAKRGYEDLLQAYAEGPSVTQVSDAPRALGRHGDVSLKSTAEVSATPAAATGPPHSPVSSQAAVPQMPTVSETEPSLAGFFRGLSMLMRGALDDAYLWLPLLIGIVIGRWLIGGVSDWVNDEPLTWTAVLSRILAVLLLATTAAVVLLEEAPAAAPLPAVQAPAAPSALVPVHLKITEARLVDAAAPRARIAATKADASPGHDAAAIVVDAGSQPITLAQAPDLKKEPSSSAVASARPLSTAPTPIKASALTAAADVTRSAPATQTQVPRRRPTDAQQSVYALGFGVILALLMYGLYLCYQLYHRTRVG